MTAPEPDGRRVSVVIPAHDAATTIGGTLTGALTQTHADVEVVVVDDGSTDDTAAIVAAHGDRVVLVRQEHAGVSAARNAGMAAATGDHVVFCDADDIMLPHHVSRALAVLDEAPARSFVASQALVLDTDGIRQGNVLGFEALPPQRQRREVLEGNIIPIHVLFPTAMSTEIGPMDADLDRCEDWEYWIRAIVAGWRVAYQMEPSALHRTTPGSLSSHQEAMWDAEEHLIASLPSRLGAHLTPDERAYLSRRHSIGSPHRLHTHGDAVLASGDLATAHTLYHDAGSLSRRDVRARVKAFLTRVPVASRLLVTWRRRRDTHRPSQHQENA